MGARVSRMRVINRTVGVVCSASGTDCDINKAVIRRPTFDSCTIASTNTDKVSVIKRCLASGIKLKPLARLSDQSRFHGRKLTANKYSIFGECFL